MNKQDVIFIKNYFKQKDMKVIKISMLLGIILVQLPNGNNVKYNIDNFLIR